MTSAGRSLSSAPNVYSPGRGRAMQQHLDAEAGRVPSDRYRTLMPPTGEGVWWLCCNECGASVLDRDAHDAWHLAVRSAITMLDRRRCSHGPAA